MVLIFHASPRPSGDTAYLIDCLTRRLPGQEVHIVHTYTDNIAPCTDCRFCWQQPACCIRDGMDGVYEKLQTADWIILASPIHFDEVSGSLLQLASRLQPFWMAQQKRGEQLLPGGRHGAALLTGGCSRPAEAAHKMCRRLLHCMGAECEQIIHAKDTDHLPVRDNRAALEEVSVLAQAILRTVPSDASGEGGMEQLLVYALLFVNNMVSKQEYQNELDRLFLAHPDREDLQYLEWESNLKHAILHILSHIDSSALDTKRFGRILMRQLKAYYQKQPDLHKTAEKFYALWGSLPAQLQTIDPFWSLNDGDDPLGWGDEAQTRAIYEEMMNYYEG